MRIASPKNQSGPMAFGPVVKSHEKCPIPLPLLPFRPLPFLRGPGRRYPAWPFGSSIRWRSIPIPSFSVAPYQPMQRTQCNDNKFVYQTTKGRMSKRLWLASNRPIDNERNIIKHNRIRIRNEFRISDPERNRTKAKPCFQYQLRLHF